MAEHKTTESVEMYLAAISMAETDDENAPVPISALADQLFVQPVSVNQMVKKMEKDGLVEYIPYKGVQLTARGKEQALRVLRHRRLWEVFFVKDLGMSLEDADRLACDFEHVTDAEMANRLAVFLGKPSVCFHGNPIPQMDDAGLALFAGIPLGTLQVGESAQVMRVDAEALTTDFLFTEGIKPGVRARIVALGQHDTLLVESEGRRVRLSAEIASQIIVGKPETV